jgi:UDP-N-acetylglucosamine/UDP-N-acetylgalactosamine diphosphorylase
MMDRASARRRLSRHGQEHVLRFFDELGAQEQAELLAQIEQLDLDWLDWVWRTELRPPDPKDVAPYPGVILEDDAEGDRAVAAGEEALRAGRVGALIVAGGQGTRLGFAGPKGALVIGAVSGRTLFQIHAERLVALGRRYGVVPPLYVMTSEANHDATVALFAERRCFGLPEDRVRLFAQGQAPAVDPEGKLLLEAKGRIVLAPNGNGGLFAALRRSGALDHMERVGVDVVSFVQVDNPLSLSCDPRFVGYHLLRRSDFSCKAIRKRDPSERVGCYARVRGRLAVVEYTELPRDLAEQRDARGELLFSFSNPGLFVWSRDFLAVQAGRRDLPFHRAHKKIPHLDASGRLVQPEAPCGYKLEAFAMDTLPDATRSLVLSCDREAEFAPVKNTTGADSPESARALMTRLGSRWIAAAGGRIVRADARIEISPLFALDEAELRAKLPAGFVVERDLYLS